MEQYLIILMVFMFVIPAVRAYGIRYLQSEWQVKLLTKARLVAMVGGFCNILVMVANLGMPVRGLAYRYGIWKPMTDDTILPMLGDYIRVSSYTFSVGDILLGLAGIGLLICLPSIIWRWVKRGKVAPKEYRVRY